MLPDDNTKISCTRRIQFCAGHRVHLHESKCRNPHGHNYVAFVEAEAPHLDGVGRVIDFSVLKERVGGWIDANWDHAFICFAMDADLVSFFGRTNAKLHVMPYNPTAENMARYLLHMVCPVVLAGTGVTVTRVTVWETENCFAVAALDTSRGLTMADAEAMLRLDPSAMVVGDFDGDRA